MNPNKTAFLELVKGNKHQYYYYPFIFRFYPFTEEQLFKYKELIWWDALSENKNIKWTSQILFQFKDLLDWENRMWKNPSLPVSIDFIKNYNDINYYHLAMNEGSHWNAEFITSLKDRWNWHYLLLNESINWTQELFIQLNLFDKRISILNGKDLWTERFVLDNMNKFHWSYLCQNPHLPWSAKFIEKLKPIWSPFFWNGITINSGIPWSIDFIEKYAENDNQSMLIWSGLSLNESLPWNGEFVEKYEDKWDWVVLSGNNGVGFTLTQIEKYSDRILWKRKHPNFGALSDNTSLPWSEELIDTYLDKWCWEDLAQNEGILWNERMIKKYEDKLDLNLLFQNPSLPWSLDFLIAHEKEISTCWSMDRNTEKCRQIIWDKVFTKFMDDEVLDTVLNTSF